MSINSSDAKNEQSRRKPFTERALPAIVAAE